MMKSKPPGVLHRMKVFKKPILLLGFVLLYQPCFCWGFFAHKKINYYAVFMLPPQLLRFYKPYIEFLSEHAVDPDKRRYAIAEEGPRHYIDMDRYGAYPYDSLPRQWDSAVLKFSEDTLIQHGIVPWWTQVMQHRLTTAFKEKDASKVLKLSAELGHYVADAHVPLHTSSNHNGQRTGQHGIHGFWESRIPELLAEKEWDFFIGHADYISAPGTFIWKRILQSAAAADSVLAIEKALTQRFSPDQKFAFEQRNGKLMRQYSTSFSKAYDGALQGMVERRMRDAIYAVASLWYTAWVDAGQPDLSLLRNNTFSEADIKEFEWLNQAWRTNVTQSREHE
jgi:hypothetical protein